MAKLSNSPLQLLTLELERRKSFLFRVAVLHENREPVDLTGCTVRLVVKASEYDDDHYDLSNLVVNSTGDLGDPTQGSAVFNLQAAELDQDPGEYYGTLVLWTSDNYSVSLAKIQLILQPNTESDSMHRSYTTGTSAAAVEVKLRDGGVVNLVAGNLGTGPEGPEGPGGPEGPEGPPGPHIASGAIDVGGNLVFTMSDATTLEPFSLGPVIDPAVSAWLAAHPPAGVTDATAGSKGVLQLSGDLGGTATAPTVPGLANKADSGHTHNLDAIADTATRVAFTPAERTKLTGIATGATANASDASLRSRSTHTGTQDISTVTGLQAALDGKAAALGTDDNYVTDAEKALLPRILATPINAQTGTSYTAVASDAGKTIEHTNAAASTLTIPSGVFSAGQRIDVLVAGAGQLTVVAGSGMTVEPEVGLQLKSRAQRSMFSVYFRSSTVAVVTGSLALA